jgi:hypothetical protein
MWRGDYDVSLPSLSKVWGLRGWRPYSVSCCVLGQDSRSNYCGTSLLGSASACGGTSRSSTCKLNISCNLGLSFTGGSG